ncbi:MAG TPA: hypothetical protein DDW28_08215 [Prevotella sp.]|nr:hypothetical protein [Candidatus Segatella violae]
MFNYYRTKVIKFSQRANKKEKKGKKYAQFRGICALKATFFAKIFAYIKKNVFLCTRIFN